MDGTQGLIDSRSAPIVRAPVRQQQALIPQRGEILLDVADEAAEYPAHELTYWTGQIVNDADGNVYPKLIRSTAAIGVPGCRPSAIPGVLEYSDFLAYKQSHGQIRVDGLLAKAGVPNGLLPAETRTSRAAYVETCNKLQNKDLMVELVRMGVTLHRHVSLVPNWQILDRLQSAKRDTTEETLARDAAKRCEEGYKKWAALLDEVAKETANDEPKVLADNFADEPNALYIESLKAQMAEMQKQIQQLMDIRTAPAVIEEKKK